MFDDPLPRGFNERVAKPKKVHVAGEGTTGTTYSGPSSGPRTRSQDSCCRRTWTHQTDISVSS